jgi:hypothetical protein
MRQAVCITLRDDNGNKILNRKHEKKKRLRRLSAGGTIILKRFIRRPESDLDSYGSGQGPVVGSCQHHNKILYL